MRILYNSKCREDKSPFGTLKVGESCSVSVRIPVSCKTVRAELVFLKEDHAPYASFVMELCESDELYERYRAVFALGREGLYFYYFRIQTENEAFSLYRQGFDQTNMESGDFWQLTCTPRSFSVPEEFAGRVMYQIFPDRFHQAGNPSLEGKLMPYSVHLNRQEIPCYLPDENGQVLNCDFFGGNLAGICEKLDYLAEMGVGVLYLNPIFKAYSNHRYDTADYLRIDEMLGNEEDLRNLCQKAHEKGILIILDGVFSHTGSNSVYFDAKGIFGGGAVSDPESPYRSWYEFQSYPDRYTAWWGIRTLPCVRESDEGFLRYIIDGEDSVVAHWLSVGVDGFRLDVADELPDEFILRLRQRMKKINPKALLIGEVWEDASNKISYGVRRSYFTRGELDSVMNYPLRDRIIDFVLGKDGGRNFCQAMMELCENYPPEVFCCLMNFLSTHDTVRILTALSPLEVPADRAVRSRFRMGAEARGIAKERYFCALFLQFALPGMPCLYYGDEIGMEGYEDPFCRGYFEWERVDRSEIRPTVCEISRLRAREEALQSGDLSLDSEDDGAVTVSRNFRGERIRCVVNVRGTKRYLARGEILFSRNVTRSENTLIVEANGFFAEKITSDPLC